MTSHTRRLAVLITAAMGLVLATTACNPKDVVLFNAITGASNTVDMARSQCLQVAGDPGDPGGACEKMAFEVAIHRAWPWIDEMRMTARYEDCIASHETPGSTHPYTQEHGGDRGGYSSASGRYQFLDKTWQTWLARAEVYWGREISNTTHAADADPWMQDAVAARAIIGGNASDWKWSDCKKFKPPVSDGRLLV